MPGFCLQPKIAVEEKYNRLHGQKQWSFFLHSKGDIAWICWMKSQKSLLFLWERGYGEGEWLLTTTVKTLIVGTPRLTTVVVLNIKQFNFTMQ